MKKIFTSFFTLMLILFGCQPIENQFTEDEINENLKRTLKFNVENSYQKLLQKDNFIDKNSFFSFSRSEQETLDNLVLSINKVVLVSLEKAKQIYLKEISNFDFENPYSILNGENFLFSENYYDSMAITHYLEYEIRNKIFDQLNPIVVQNMKKDLGLGFSCFEAWNDLNQQFGNSTVVLNGDLDEFITNLILDNFFIEMGKLETKLRENPNLYADVEIEKLFSHTYEKIN